jgi:mannose-6-phosphate isomerase
VGEAWVSYGESVVAAGPLAGSTLSELAARFGAGLVGSAAAAGDAGHDAGRDTAGWPLLIKLLDCAGWLSIQVHPNDEQARLLAGPGESGKAEAWFVVEAEPGACILLGARPGVDATELASAIRQGRAVDVAARVGMETGQAVLIPAGTLHALGPGLLLYEIQQQSDITYRAYDWGRPASAGRSLHIEESVAVALPAVAEAPRRPARPSGSGLGLALECAHFVLELGRVEGGDSLSLRTDGSTFHAITLVEGTAEASAGDERARLARFQTVLVPASAGEYRIHATDGPAEFLRASVPA